MVPFSGRYFYRRILNVVDLVLLVIILKTFIKILPNSSLEKHGSSTVTDLCGSNATLSPLVRKICEVEANLLFFNPFINPVIVKDVSFQRYYATRDLQGWTIAFNNRSMHVVERSITSSVSANDFSIFICLTLSGHDKYCITPKNLRNLEQWQRYGQIYGLRHILWRKDSFCWSMTEALSGFKRRRNFTFPCWVLPQDITSLEKEMSTHYGEPYIAKPNNKGEGHGIFVIRSYNELLKRGTLAGYVLQPFLKVLYL